MDGGLARSRQEPPDLIGRDRENRRQQPRDAIGDHVDRRLGGPPLDGIGAERVEPILRHVEIERAEIDRHELVHGVEDRLKVVRRVGLLHRLGQPRVDGEHVAVDFEQTRLIDRIEGRVEVVQVGEQVLAQRVADLPVGFDGARQHFLAEAHLVPVVDHRDPQPDDLGAALFHHLLRRDDVAEGLGHLAPLLVDNEPVRQHGAVRRVLARADADEQRRLEPAAILVGAFQVQISRPRELRAAASTASWLEPESNHTSRMSRSRVNAVPPHLSQVRPGGVSAAVSSSYHASALAPSNNLAACSISAGVSVDSPQPSQLRAGIGTPHARWREMHQSGRATNMPVIRSRPHSGIHRTALASDTAAARMPSMLMNHWGVARKITG